MLFKKVIIFSILLFPVCYVYAQDLPVIPKNTTVIESYDMSNYFLVCTNSSGAARLVLDGDDTPEGQWNIVEGLTGTDTVSLMPEELPDHYMRHRGFVFYCDPSSNESLYLNDATFLPVPGLADSSCVSFRSVNYSSRYLMHDTSNPMRLVLQTVEPGNEGRATFKFPDETIYSPEPADGSYDIPIESLTLRWPVIPETQYYVLYFGTSFEDVENASFLDPCDTLIDFQIQKNYYALDTLTKGQTYYWRIDSIINGINDIQRGQVWSFTTSNSLILDDFESYTDNIEAGETIFQTWIDGWGNPYNGSLAGYLESPFAERSIVYKGQQSMPFLYDNISGFAWMDMPWPDFWDWLIDMGYEEPNAIISKTTRYYDEPMDWISDDNDYHYLVFNVRGNIENSGGKFYTKINDYVVYNTDPNIITSPRWKQWAIDFNDIVTDLNDVNSLSVGIEGIDSGIIYIDEIALYHNPPGIAGAQDPGNKNLAAWYKMDGNLIDQSGADLDGLIFGNPAFVQGIDGMGLSLDGDDDYASLPIGNVIAQSTEMTIACWVNFTNQGGSWQRIFDFGSGTSVNMFLTPRTGTTGPMRFAIRTASIGEQQLTAPETLQSGWHHVAIIIRGSNDTMEMYLDAQKIAEGTTLLAPEDLGITTQNWIGHSQYSSDANFYGTIDDFRIYTRSLTESELTFLTQVNN